MRVLIVDNCERFRATMRQACGAFGYGVADARNVTSAGAPLREKRFDLVIAQLHREPGRNVAVIVAVHTETLTPILFVGQRGLPDLPEALAGGAEAITAPFPLKALSDRIVALVKRHREPAIL